MATTNIDRSLDDIIKEQRKLKKIKAQKLKAQQVKKKQTPQKQGKKKTGQTVANQNQRKKATTKKNGRYTQQGRGMQGRAAVSGKQKKTASQGRKNTQNTRKKQNTGNASRGRINGARVTVNRLKNKQGSLQKTKKIVTKAKKIQQNQQRVNRQTRQKQQKDARQNIINNRRGMQSAAKGNKGGNVQNMRKLPNRNSGATKLQRTNRKGITSSLLTVSINNPRVRLNRASPQWQQATNSIQTNRRNWRGGARSGGLNKIMDTGDLRISIPNNFFQLPPATLKPQNHLPNSHIDDGVSSVNKPKTYATLNERFSNFAMQSGRTIIVE